MAQTETPHLSEVLAAKTEPGRVQDWIERIAAIAGAAGLNRSRIAWQGSPINIAHEVVRHAERCDRLQRLKDAIETYHSE